MQYDPLTSREYWQSQETPFKPFIVTGNPFASLLQRYLPVNPNLQCVEVGAYPGGYLCYLSKQFGYSATAIEYRNNAGDIVKLFKYNNIAAPEIINTDFFKVERRLFDVVSSFGFAEHFADLQKVINQHVKLIKPGGFLVLTMPQLRGYQWLVRRLVYTREAWKELHSTHNVAVMRLGVVKRTLKNSGLVVKYAGYAMNAHLWIRADSPKVKDSLRWLVSIFTWLDRFVGKRLPSFILYSPMIFTVSIKPR